MVVVRDAEPGEMKIDLTPGLIIGKIEKITLSPNDLIVIMCDGISHAARLRIQEGVDELLGEGSSVGILFLPADADIKVIQRTAESSE